jgi:perosamine synthetase
MIRHSASHLIPSDLDYVSGILERNHVGPGVLCAELRGLLAEKFARPSVTLTDSATGALLLCLLALAARHPIKRRVLVGAYVCPEVISAVMRADLEPVLVDTRADSLNVDMSAMARQVDERTLAVVCTNIGGIPDDYAAASGWGVPVISDCAQAIGSRLASRDVASEGACAILSFGATKMLSAGCGGAVLADDGLGAEVAILARPELTREEYLRGGFRPTVGQHMSDLTAGLALAQLRRLESMVERRRRIADAYDEALMSHSDATLMRDRDLVKSNRFRYYFLSDQAGIWIEKLRSTGIDARPSISHVIPEYLGDFNSFPNLLYISRHLVSVPIFPAMTSAQVGFIAEALNSSPEGT